MRVKLYNLSKLSDEKRRELYSRTLVNFKDLISKVAPIIDDVKHNGNKAVIGYSRRFDGAEMTPEDLRVPESEIQSAYDGLESNLREAIEVSIANIRKFHERQVEETEWQTEISPGIMAGERIVPIRSAALYVPRGKGSFPSMMMMAGVPAKTAGVPRIVVISPPDRHGKADAATLAAAYMIGITEIYVIGGVQAVAALAYGTETIPAVDKIVGPGSGYVLAAKHLLSTEVDTGLPAGPSEAIVYADETVDTMTVVKDLLIEAEHGPDSAAYLVTLSSKLADEAMMLIPKVVSELPEERRSFCESVFESNGGVILARDIDDAAAFINGFAPEHLQILSKNPDELWDKIYCAGEVLLGPYTPGTLANYSIGPNAILPTSGFARTASALSVRDFTRRVGFARVSEQGFAALAPKTLVLAEYEGFAAHAAALKHRLERPKNE